ncbi:MarR family transcriptional regulator [Sphingomonas sp. KR1UV-12]|uniref:MarR family transcriptional regulator n=1 Tax=Sphingomonas aurea TaxID=3063994 RepID=A0ABT9ELR8_9SPHN|nr:MarR family transcriptional regulator [Sphingomonas sp. KR1UV-12]MDP1027733.1 MarR family transcriptional regulator [Sphingomonas sp. KR1UV-12]
MVRYSDTGYSPDRSIGYLVRRAHLLGSSALEPMFASEGLTGMQWSALVLIWFKPGATAADLARELGHDKGAMTRLVDQLAERGWITRERVPEDRRCINLSVTETGAAVALRCKHRVVACWNDWLSDWPEAEVETLIVLLQKLRATLTDAEGPCA